MGSFANEDDSEYSTIHAQDQKANPCTKLHFHVGLFTYGTAPEHRFDDQD
jgi:hypothetical protein